jgi:hypothetical protein
VIGNGRPASHTREETRTNVPGTVVTGTPRQTVPPPFPSRRTRRTLTPWMRRSPPALTSGGGARRILRWTWRFTTPCARLANRATIPSVVLPCVPIWYAKQDGRQYRPPLRSAAE